MKLDEGAGAVSTHLNVSRFTETHLEEPTAKQQAGRALFDSAIIQAFVETLL
ncbi:MAG: hypothetical protein PSX36_15165 [bacterium]|nr:hypothetical protein [bacterium]